MKPFRRRNSARGPGWTPREQASIRPMASAIPYGSDASCLVFPNASRTGPSGTVAS
jgi:hypothetical protein